MGDEIKGGNERGGRDKGKDNMCVGDTSAAIIRQATHSQVKQRNRVTKWPMPQPCFHACKGKGAEDRWLKS